MNHSLIDKTLDIKSIVANDTKFSQLTDKKEYISINNVFNLIETISSTQNEEILKEDGKQYRIDKENEENEEKLDYKESFPSIEKNVANIKKLEFILIRKKRGRKEKGKRMKIHGKDNFDNLQTKIQVHFLSFIINLSNDVISSELELKKDYKFKEIDYSIKKKVNFHNSSEFKNSNIKDILEKKISSKIKKYPKNINQILIKTGIKSSSWLEKFFNIKYLDLFNEYYYNKEEPLKEFNFGEKKIVLSNKTKSFYDLLLKKGNENLKNELSDTAKRVYFYGYNKLIGKNAFESNQIKFN